MALADLVRQLGEALVAAAPPPAPDLTPAHFTALGKLIGGLPVGELVTLIHGQATLDNVLDLSAEAAGIVAAAFPPAAITSGEVEFGLEALRLVFDVAGLGSQPFRITPGQNPIRGGFEGARGHV
jgi:hypothetical protein